MFIIMSSEVTILIYHINFISWCLLRDKMFTYIPLEKITCSLMWKCGFYLILSVKIQPWPMQWKQEYMWFNFIEVLENCVGKGLLTLQSFIWKEITWRYYVSIQKDVLKHHTGFNLRGWMHKGLASLFNSPKNPLAFTQHKTTTQ